MYSIKEVANKLNITKHALYYYEKTGLLPPISRDKKEIEFILIQI